MKMENKLYTEEEVRKAIELAQKCEHDCGGVYFDYTETEIIENLTPIELPIIEYLKEKIKKDEENKDHWEENHQNPMAYYYRKLAVHRIAAFKEVVEFITDNFNDNGE